LQTSNPLQFFCDLAQKWKSNEIFEWFEVSHASEHQSPADDWDVFTSCESSEVQANEVTPKPLEITQNSNSFDTSDQYLLDETVPHAYTR
jgi:hypothetical protein